MTERPTPEEIRRIRELFEEAESESDAPSLGAGSEASTRFERRAAALFEGRPPPVAAGAAGQLVDRLRSFWTAPRLSYAANFVFLVLLLAGWNYRVYLTPLVARTIVEGDTVTIADARFHDKVVWSHAFDGGIHRVEVAPWDGGSRFVLVAVEGREKLHGSLHLWDFKRDFEVWVHRIPREELVPLFGEETANRSGMKCWDFDFADLEGDGEPEIAAIFRHFVMMPGCVRTLDRGGDVLGTYYNFGYLEDVHAVDIDGDGKDEIVAAGTNNARAYQGGTVILLDEDHLSGGSADDQVWSDGRVEDGSLVRVVFPKFEPEVMEFLGPIERLHAWGIVEDPGASEPTLLVNLGFRLVPSQPLLVLYLDPLLRVRQVVRHGSFATWGREAYERGELPVDPSSDAWLNDWLSRHRRFGALADAPSTS